MNKTKDMFLRLSAAERSLKLFVIIIIQANLGLKNLPSFKLCINIILYVTSFDLPNIKYQAKMILESIFKEYLVINQDFPVQIAWIF